MTMSDFILYVNQALTAMLLGMACVVYYRIRKDHWARMSRTLAFAVALVVPSVYVILVGGLLHDFPDARRAATIPFLVLLIWLFWLISRRDWVKPVDLRDERRHLDKKENP